MQNPESTHNNQLNNSISKMQYSIPKQRRFRQSIEKGVPYYDLPPINLKRAPSFGLGHKVTFEDRRVIPPPNTYRLPSEFQAPNNPISIGLGRQLVKNNSVFKTNDNPGPGTYTPKDHPHQISVSLKSKVRDNSLDEKIKVPGPGSYDPIEIINKLGQYVTSKHKNSKAPSFTKSVRRIKTQQIPGPGNYDPIVINSRGEKSFLQSKSSAKFSNTKRNAIYVINSNPGPGQYEHFSEFIR